MMMARYAIENSLKNDQLIRLHARETFNQHIRRENLRTHISFLYGEGMLQQVKELDKLRNRKQRLLSALAFLKRCRDDRIVPTFAKIVHHIQTPAANRITRRASLALVRERIRDTRRQLDSIGRKLFALHLELASLLAPTTWDWVETSSWAQAERAQRNASKKQSSKFNRLASKQPQQEPRRTVLNLTGKNIDVNALSVLEKGLNFAPTPAALPVAEFISSVEQVASTLPPDTAEEIRRETCRTLTSSAPPRHNITRRERAALRSLRDDPDVVVLPADKGNITVLLTATEYKEKMYKLLDDPAYRKITTDPTSRIQRKTIELLRSTFTDETAKKLRPRAAVPPRLYGLPKVHKTNIPLRPIVSTIGAPTYHLAKHLTSVLSPQVGKCEHHIKNSAQFVERIRKLRLSSSDLMVSFDVVSLFTRVPLKESLELIEKKFGPSFTKVFNFVLTSTYFLFDGDFYEQTDGVPMGSPLSPVVANMYMEEFEEQALDTAPLKPTVFYRYVDDTFVIWPHGEDALQVFLQHLNSIHSQIQFTMEVEQNGQLPFLDVLVRRKPDGTLGHSVYRKKTHTDQYLHASSCHHPSQREGVLNTLVHRARVISDEESLRPELDHLREVFQKNGYSDRQIRRAFKKKSTQQPTPEEEPPKKIAYIPYAGNISGKIGRILRRHNIKSVYRPPAKIKSLLGTVKDDLGLRKSGVYHIPCECGKAYVGQTIRTIEERCTEHKRHTDLQQPTKSAIAEHCLESKHRMKYENTEVLHNTTHYWDCVYKEAIEIRLRENLINKDSGFQLSQAWNPALKLLRTQRKHNTEHDEGRAQTEDRHAGTEQDVPPPLQHPAARTRGQWRGGEGGAGINTAPAGTAAQSAGVT